MNTLVPLLYHVAPLVDWLMAPVPVIFLLLLLPMPFLIDYATEAAIRAVDAAVAVWKPKPRRQEPYRYDQRWH